MKKLTEVEPFGLIPFEKEQSWQKDPQNGRRKEWGYLNLFLFPLGEFQLWHVRRYGHDCWLENVNLV